MLRDDPGAWLISRVGSLAMDWVPAIRRHFLAAGGREINSILGDPQALETAVRNMAAMAAPPAGTCRLGSLDDPDAALDSRCRVIGVEGMRVVDVIGRALCWERVCQYDWMWVAAVCLKQ